ncbi:MAG: hypothetical protein HY794_10010 [Desulfarculus sp.]|nr:hypothetical protein [Desulfarculus sp.]
MSLLDERQKLKTVICDFITDAMLPRQVAQRVAMSLEGKPDPEIMAQAIEGAQAKVRLIIEHIPHLTSQAFLLRIPSPEFLEFVLFSEYILLNSLKGERGALRYAKKAREQTHQTLARCLNRLGFFSPQDLEPYQRQIVGTYEDGPAMWERMIQSLSQNPKERLRVLRAEKSEAGADRPLELDFDQDRGAPAPGRQERTARGLAALGAQRGQGGA